MIKERRVTVVIERNGDKSIQKEAGAAYRCVLGTVFCTVWGCLSASNGGHAGQEGGDGDQNGKDSLFFHEYPGFL